MPAAVIDAVTALARRRGFFFPAGEIYGTSWSAWDFGPLGVELKENVRRHWWRAVVQSREDVVGMDSAVILPPQVWSATRHVTDLAEQVVVCQACRRRALVDDLENDFAFRAGRRPAPGLAEIGCPRCGAKDSWTEPQVLNGMVPAGVGAALTTDDSDRRERPTTWPSDAFPDDYYLRPEASQGAFTNLHNVLRVSRRKPPFGIAQVGKAFRNVFTPGQDLFHTREFEQMQLDYFVPPTHAAMWLDFWLQARHDWYVDLGIAPANLRWRNREPQTMAHAAVDAVDIEYRFGFADGPLNDGFAALENVVNRGDGDLRSHSQHSGADLAWQEHGSGERWFPHVIEPSVGIAHSVLAFLVDAYDVDEAPDADGNAVSRSVLRLHPRLAPVKVAVLPLSRHAELSPRARRLADGLRSRWNVEFDDAGAIGRRYRRQDEIGTPYCVTFDFESLDDHAVTIRDRATMAQERVALDRVQEYLAQRLPAA